MLSEDIATRQPSAEDASGWLDCGLGLLDADKTDDALAAIARATELAPDDVAAWRWHAIVLSGMDRNEEALQSRETITRLTPDDPDAWFELGLNLTALNRHDEALSADRRAAELEPGTPRHLLNVAFDLRQLDRGDEALSVLAEACELWPDDPDVWQTRASALAELGHTNDILEALHTLAVSAEGALGVWRALNAALSEQGRDEEALAALGRITDQRPDDPWVWSEYGVALSRLGRHDDALVADLRAAELDPLTAQHQTYIAIDLTELGRDEEAMQAYSKAAELSPDDFAPLLNQAATLTRLGRYDDAAAVLARAAEIAPANPYVAAQRLVTLHRASRPDEANQLLEAIPNDWQDGQLQTWHGALSVELLGLVGRLTDDNDPEMALLSTELATQADPSNEDAAAELVQQLDTRREHSRAQQALDDGLSRLPNSVGLRTLKGEFARQEQDFVEAERIFRELVEEYPNDPVPVTHLAFVLRLARKLGDAEQVLAQYPSDEPGVTYERGMCWYQLGDYGRAAEAFERFITDYPDDVDGWEMLVECHRLRRDHAAATDALSRAGMRWPDREPRALTIQRSWLMYAQGDADDATSTLRDLVATDPTDSEAWRTLAAILRSEGAFDAAAAVLASAAEQMESEPDELAVERAWLAYDRGDLPMAAGLFDGLVTRTPSVAEHWYGLALCRRVQGDLTAAEDVLDRANQVFTVEPPTLTLERGWLTYAHGDHLRAADIFARFVQRQPRNTDGWRALLSCRRTLREYDVAVQAVADALSVLPDEPQILLEQGWLAVDQVQYAAGAEIFARVVSTDNRSAEAAEGLVMCRRLQRDYDAAEAALAEAARVPEPFALALQRGWLAVDRGRYDEGVQVFDNLVADQPNLLQGWLALARCHRFRRDFAAAREALSKAHSVAPDRSTELVLEQAWLFYEEENYQAAEQAFREIVERQPRNTDGWLGLCRVRRAQSDFSGASAVLDEAAVAMATATPSHMLFSEHGWLAYDRGDFESAEATFRQVRQQTPEDEDALLAVLDALRARGEFGDAESLLNESQAPGSPWLEMERGWLLTEQRRADEAAAVFKSLSESSPGFIQAWVQWAQLLRRQRRFEQANDALQQAFGHFDRSDPPLLLEEGWLAFDRNRYEDAYETFRSVPLGPKAIAAGAAIVQTLRKWGRLDDADDELTELVDRYGPNPELLIERAELAYTRGTYEAALADFEAAQDYWPASPNALRGHIDTLRHLGDLTTARSLGEQAHGRQPHDVLLRIALALVYTQSRDPADAGAAVRLAESVLGDTWEPAQLAQVARILREAGQVDRAEQIVVGAMRDSPNTPPLCNELAAIRIWQFRTEDALTALRDCLEIDPHDRSALIWTAVVLRREGRWNELREHIDTACERLSMNHRLHVEYGWLLYHDYKFDDALAEFRRARQLSPSLVNAWVGESRCLCALDRHIEAAVLVRTEMNRGNKSSLTIEFARILHGQGLHEQALDQLAGLTGDPTGQREAKMERVQVLMALKQFDRAEQELCELADGRELTQKLLYAVFCVQLHGSEAQERVERIVEDALKQSEERNAEVYGCLGILAQNKGDLRTAESMYRLALKLDRYSRWRVQLAEVLIRSARYPEAEAELKEVLTLEPTSVNGRHWLGQLQYQSGLVRESALTFRSALATEPWHVGSICGLAMSLVAQDNDAAAERELRRAVELLSKDENDAVLLRLAAVLIQRGDQTGNDSYYRQAAAEATKIFTDPDPYVWGLRRGDVEGEARYLRGVANYKLAEAALEPRTAGHFQSLAQRDFNKLRGMGQLSRYPDAARLCESLRRTISQVARVALPGYLIAFVCLVLVGLLWYQHFNADRASETLMATLTPILIGLAAVAVLYPILAHLKMPGFEAEIRQPQLNQIASSAETVVTFGTAFLGASPRDIVTHEYGGLGAFAPTGAPQAGSEPVAGHAATAVTDEGAPQGKLPEWGDNTEPPTRRTDGGAPEGRPAWLTRKGAGSDKWRSRP